MSTNDSRRLPRTGAVRGRTARRQEHGGPRTRGDDAQATLRALTRLEKSLTGARRALDAEILRMADRPLDAPGSR